MSGAAQTCPSCGATNPSDSQFCRDCGAILIRSGDAARRTPPSGDSTIVLAGGGGGPAPQPPGGNRKNSAIVAVVIVVILAVAMLFYNQREQTQIPVPGEAPVAPTVAAEPTEVPTPPRRPPTQPPEPPPPREPEAAREPERATEPVRPREPERAREPDYERRPEPEPPVVERGTAGRSSSARWYRVKFRAPLFQSPSETAPIVTYLKAGTRIRVTRVVPGFLAVESTTGKAPGYVSTDDAAPEDASSR